MFANILPRRVGSSVAVALLTLLTVAVPTRVAAAQGAGQTGDDAGPWIAPERASRRANPHPVEAKSIKQGRDLFERECAKCHGKLGRGDGPQAAFLEVKPQDLTASVITSQSDGALFWKITEGRGPMPKAKLNDDDKWLVIDYLRTLSHKP